MWLEPKESEARGTAATGRRIPGMGATGLKWAPSEPAGNVDAVVSAVVAALTLWLLGAIAGLCESGVSCESSLQLLVGLTLLPACTCGPDVRFGGCRLTQAKVFDHSTVELGLLQPSGAGGGTACAVDTGRFHDQVRCWEAH